MQHTITPIYINSDDTLDTVKQGLSEFVWRIRQDSEFGRVLEQAKTKEANKDPIIQRQLYGIEAWALLVDINWGRVQYLGDLAQYLATEATDWGDDIIIGSSNFVDLFESLCNKKKEI